MAQEIYHRSEWGNPSEQWGNVYLNADLTNELYKRASEYENSWVTDQLLNGVGIKPSIILTPTAYEDGKLNSVKPQKTFGSELVTNGGFDTNTNWTKGVGWTISGGAANFNTTSNSSILQNLSITSGKKYRIQITGEITSGALKLTNGSGLGNDAAFTLPLDVTYTHDGGANTIEIRTIGASVGYLDNVSVKEVIDADFDFTRGSSATRVNEQGLIQDVQILSGELVQNGNFKQIGSELVTNGDFSDNSWWGLDPVWSISNGSANCNGSGVIYKGGVLTVGKTYKVQVEISSYTSGTLTYPNASYTLPSAVGSYTFYYKANSQTISFTGSSFIGSIDNVSVKEVGQNWDFGTGWSMGDGKAVKTSGTGSSLFQTVPTTTIGKKYKFTFDAIVTGGVANAALYGVTIPNFSTSGSQEHTIIATSTTGFYFFGSSSFEGSIDNVSVIEVTDDTNLPRIDYTDGEGSLLLEPQSTNLITYSEDFSQWIPNDFTANSETTIAPDGNQVNGYDFGDGFIYINTANLDGSSSYTNSIYIKANKSATIGMRKGGAGSNFNDSAINLTTDWVRFESTSVAQTTNNGRLLLDNRAVNGYGVADLKVFIWGAQLEQQSYATSYIPTNGSTVTRLADVCNNSGNSDLINSTEGVLYSEFYLDANSTEKWISLSDGTSTNRIIIYTTSANTFRVYVQNSNGGQVDFTSPFTFSQYNKVAFKYKQNDFALFINGVKLGTDTNGGVPSGLDRLNFSDANGTTNPFIGNVKCVAVFKEALSDTELQKLTTI
jgi:hypothetical protein